MANLAPEAKAYLELFNQMPAFHTMDPQTVRELLGMAPQVEVEMAPVAKVEECLIAVSGNDEIRLRIYTPEGKGPFPVFVYFHGGGWVIGDLETAHASCQMIANVTKRVVVSVDYRLAPEHKYPIPLQDSYTALKWVKENAERLNGNASNIVVGGDSAGGNLSAAISMMARDQNGPEIVAQILIYPVTDLGYDTKSYQEFQKGFGLDRDFMIWFGDHYIRSVKDKKDPYAAPLQANNLGDLPPALVIVCENDVLRDEGLAYAQRLQEAGVRVETNYEEGLVHGYFTNMAAFPQRIKGTIAQIHEFLSKIDNKVQNTQI